MSILGKRTQNSKALENKTHAKKLFVSLHTSLLGDQKTYVCMAKSLSKKNKN